MGGNIRAYSQLDRATCFKFDVKIYLVETAQVETEEAPSRVIALLANQPQYRILIVDDKWTNRQLLIQLLSPLSFELQEASKIMEGVETWDARQPHPIFMERRMPVMDGCEATKQIKAKTEGQATVIIALTASSLDEERDLADSAGCDAFIRKPFREAEIFDSIEKYLGQGYVCQEASNSLSGKMLSKDAGDSNSRILRGPSRPNPC